MKKLIMIAALLLICLACGFAIAEKDGDYTYKVNSDNTVTITGFNWKSNGARDIYIPEMLGNRMVSAIGDKAFMTTGNAAVSITLPDNIKSIGEQAFRGVAIKYINIPLNTKEIGGGAFAQCSVMQFRVASGHDTFATIENALYNKQTKTLICWPENKELGTIPEGIVGIGDYVFYGRSESCSVKIPETVKYIGKYAFAETKDWDGWLFNFESIETVDDYAFYNRYNLRVKKMSNLKMIGDYAFANIGHNFQELQIYDNQAIGVRGVKIGASAFRGSYINGVLSINVQAEIGDFAFSETSFSKERMNYGLNPNFLNSVKSIGEGAFNGTNSEVCRSDGEILSTIYSGVFTINVSNVPDKAFYMLDLRFDNYQAWFPRHIKLGSSVRGIGINAFGNVFIEDIELSEGLLTIKDNAFYGCEKLAKINIPASVTMIGKNVFDGCSDKLVITVEKGSYGEIWARTCGYSYVINGEKDDTSWLN